MENNRATVVETRKKTLLISVISITLGLACVFYLCSVFLAQFTIQTTTWENAWKISKGLGCDLAAYSMRPQPDKPPLEGYQQDANVWLLQTHQTLMFTSEILSDSKCLAARLMDGSQINGDFAMLIYDINRKAIIYRIRKYTK